MIPRPETADLHRRILAAAIRNGHTPRSFERMCLMMQVRARISDRMAGLLGGGSWFGFDADGKSHFVWRAAS